MRTWLWGFLGLVLVASAALIASFQPRALPEVTLPAFAAGGIAPALRGGAMSMPVARGPAGMALYALPAGATLSQAAFAFRGGAFGEQRTFRMGGILVEHPRGRLLFDTGFGRNVDRHARSAPWLMRSVIKYEKGTPIVEQLRAAGIDPRELTGIVLTHAHWDHVSGIEDLRQAPVWVNAAEAAFIRAKVEPTALIRSFEPLHYHEYAFTNGPYLGFEQSYDVFGDGSVVLVLAGGHSPGSIIAFLTLPDGTRYALLGDIVWQLEGVQLPSERPWLSSRMVDSDPARVREVIARLHALSRRMPELVLVPAHDARVWARLPPLSARAAIR